MRVFFLIFYTIFIVFFTEGCKQYPRELDSSRYDPSTSFYIYSPSFDRCLSVGEDNAIAEKCWRDSKLSFSVLTNSAGDRIIQRKGTNECLTKSTSDSISWTSCNKDVANFLFFHSYLSPQLRDFQVLGGGCLALVNSQFKIESCNVFDKSQNFLITSAKSRQAHVPKIIWSFWDKGESKMPAFYRSNVQQWREILGPEWKIRVLDAVEGSENYYRKFLAQESLPSVSWIGSKISGKGVDEKLSPYVVFSDFLRLELLFEHGGVWMDPSIIMHGSLNRFLTPLEMFGDFELSGYTSKHQSERTLSYLDSLENFFLIALPNSKIVALWKQNFRKYWEYKKPGMLASENPLFKHSNLNVSKFGDLANYLNQHLSLKFTLEQNPELKNRIFLIGDTSVEESGAFTLNNLVLGDDRKLLQLTEEEQENILGKMEHVSISKFASPNSIYLRKEGIETFFNSKNIFGKLYERAPKHQNSAQVVSPKVWTFWDRGEDKMPAFNRLNVMHWRRILEPLGYKIQVVNLLPGDPNNLEVILGGRSLLPPNWDSLDSIVTPYQSPDGGQVKMVPSIVKSDFARLALLEKFGGVWMDSSNVLIKDLNTIIVNALNESHEHEVGGYVMDGYSSKNSPVVDGVRVDGMENWFIAAKAHSSLIHEWRKAFELFWTTRKTGQQIHKHPMYLTFDFGGLGVSAPNYLNQHAALKYVLSHEPGLGQKILPVKHMQPWWFHAKVGGNASDLYRGFISPEVGEYAKEIHHDGVELLKFAGPHLTDINKHFRTLEDFCLTKNLLTELYGACD